jgi:hypothetical protein
MTNNEANFIGIDPGWASFGLAEFKESALIKVKGGDIPKASLLTFSGVPRDKGLTKFIENLPVQVTSQTKVVIERYVAYTGVSSAASEYILMLIGALQFHFESQGATVKMVRAIDWKPLLCKYLVKEKGFSNPSKDLDKKFSVAAAECITGQRYKSDHEADAICLGFLAGWI